MLSAYGRIQTLSKCHVEDCKQLIFLLYFIENKTKDSILLVSYVAQMGNRIPTLQRHNVPSKRREPIIHWRSVVFRKNGIIGYTAAKTSEVAK